MGSLWGGFLGDDPEAVGLLNDADPLVGARRDVPLPSEETDLVGSRDHSLVMDGEVQVQKAFGWGRPPAGVAFFEVFLDGLARGHSCAAADVFVLIPMDFLGQQKGVTH